MYPAARTPKHEIRGHVGVSVAEVAQRTDADDMRESSTIGRESGEETLFLVFCMQATEDMNSEVYFWDAKCQNKR